MSNGDQISLKRAVLVTVSRSNGEMCLCLDDATRNRGDLLKWQQDVHITSKPIAEESLEDLNWSEKELADFGYYILARLHAFKKLNAL